MSERHELQREQLAGYLLGALEPHEKAELERHLAGCESCRAEVELLRPAAARIPEGVEARTAPREVRDRVMSEVRRDAVGARRARRARSAWLRPALAMAAVLVVAVGVVAGYAIRDGGSSDSLTTLTAGEVPGVTAEMVREGRSGTLKLADVKMLPRDDVLQAWVRRDEKVESAKTLFVPDSDGNATAAIDDMRGVEAVMVTVEPRGGSAYPTSEPIVAVEIPQ